MLRHNVPVRRDLDQIAADNGFDFHIIDNEIYWDESRAYRFTLRQIEEQIEKPTAELHQMCLEVVDRAVKDEEILTQLAIPPLYWDVIAESWRARDPSLYGRMDFALVWQCAGEAAGVQRRYANFIVRVGLFPVAVAGGCPAQRHYSA